MKKLIALVMLIGMTLAAVTGCSSKDTKNGDVTEANNTNQAGTNSKTNKKLYFVSLNDQGPYWMPLIESAKKTAEEKGYNLIVKSGVAGDPSRPQKLLEAIQEGIDQNVAGLAMAALDPEMFDKKAEEASAKGIKVVTFDTDIATSDYRLSYIGTDNYEAGMELGKKSAADMISKGITSGKVTCITYSGSAQNMVDRYKGLQEGFAEGMGEYADNFTWCEWIINDLSASEAKRQLESQIIANEDLRAVFTLGTESVITGAMEAIKSQNKQGVLLHYGFDYSQTFEPGIEDELITAIVDQNCAEIGRTIVEKMIDAAEGKEIDNTYPIAVNWVLADEIIEYGKMKMNQ